MVGGTVVALIMYKRAVLDLEVFNGENERVMTIKRKSDAEMARVVDDVASPMLALDVQGQILIWNRALVIMFGIEKEEALKLNFMTTFVHADYIEKAQSVLNKAFERKVGTLNFELKLRYRDGPSHLLLISATPLKGLSTEVRRVLFVTSNDITKLEETRRSVRKAEAEAEYTNFLAHEVRNPLTG